MKTALIRTSRTAKFVAALLACTAHGAVAVALMQTQPPVEMEGASGGEAALGSSFADMAAGTLSAEDADELTEAEPVEETPQEPAETAETPEPVETPPEEPEAVETAEAEPVTPPEPAEPVEQLSEAEPIEAVEALELSTESDVVAAIAPEQTEPVEAVPPEPVEAVPPEPVEAIEAEEEEVSPNAVAVSRRPMQRPETLEVPEPKPQPRQAQPRPQRQTQQTTRREPEPQRRQQAAPQGNADRNARAGQATGSQSGTSASSGSGGRSSEAGNAAASNYPGQVMRKLSRVSRPRMNARGVAVVAFRISGNGGLAAVSLARSSGSAALDEAALRVVRRAAPFPRPPAGARTSYSIQIKAR